MTLLSIVIVSYNTKELTVQCLKSIINQYKKELQSGQFEIIVVDNNSSDDTIKTIQNSTLRLRSGQELKIIQNRQNFGFAKGNNIGAKKAKGKYLFFLNSDTEVKDNGLSAMINFLNGRRKVGILGARLVNPDKTTQASVGKFYNLINTMVMLSGGERIGLLRLNPQKICQVDWVSGGAMMVRADLFKKLGGFDENLFMYMEDMELCFRAKKEGIKTYYYSDITITHKQLGSSNRTFAIVNIYKGLLYFYKKHANYMEYLIVKLLLTLKAYIAIVIGILTRNGYLTSTYRKALALL